MAAALLRRNPLPHHTVTRHFSAKPSHHKDHSHNQIYLTPSTTIGTWDPPKSPKEAQSKLALLRRDYAKQVKELRKQYIHEMDLQRQDQARRDEAKKIEILRQREERNKSKAAAAKARAAQRQVFEEEFRRTLMKERTEKLEYWRTRENAIQNKKESKKELIIRQSSMWIDEENLNDSISRSITDHNTSL